MVDLTILLVDAQKAPCPYLLPVALKCKVADFYFRVEREGGR